MADEDVLIGHGEVSRALLAHLERRVHTHIDPLLLQPQEPVLAVERRTPDPERQVGATLRTENPDVTAILHTIFRRADVELVSVSTGQALLTAAARSHPGDFLIIDCSEALPDAMERCMSIVRETSIPLYIIHPRKRIMQDLREVARGELVHFHPDQAGLALLERVRFLKARPRHPASLSNLTQRQQEVLRLLSEANTNGEIARHVNMSLATVKTDLAQIRQELGLHRRQDLAKYHRQATEKEEPSQLGKGPAERRPACKPKCIRLALFLADF